jgi:hypothetical protein
MFMAGPFVLACAALIPPLFCLIFAWIRWQASKNNSVAARWRGAMAFAGLMMASVAMLMNAVFILHGAAHGRGAFYGPPGGVWLPLGRLFAVLWLGVVLAAAVGKGKQRVPLAAWSALMLASDYFVITFYMD